MLFFPRDNQVFVTSDVEVKNNTVSTLPGALEKARLFITVHPSDTSDMSVKEQAHLLSDLFNGVTYNLIQKNDETS